MSDMDKEKQYISLIIGQLKKHSTEIKEEKELKENVIDTNSGNFFECLYNNLLYFIQNSQNDNNSPSNIHKNLISGIVDVLEVLYDKKPNCFFKYDFVKSILIYSVYSFKSLLNLNNEYIIKIFLSFNDLVENVSHAIIEKEVENFESQLSDSIESLINKYINDFEKQIIIQKGKDKYQDIIDSLTDIKADLPFYLIGFLEYNNLKNPTKFLIIKIYKYFEMLNPFGKEDNATAHNLYQGYLLYGIISNKNDFNNLRFNFKKFNDIRASRIKDKNAQIILELAIHLLDEPKKNFLEKLNEKNIDFSAECPKISNNFDDTKDYYKDLYQQLKYYLSQYKKKNNKKLCKISIKIYLKIFWLNFIKLLLLNLKEEDLDKNEIKIIVFYFIVNLFNPDIDSSKSLEFSDDVVPILLSQFPLNILDDIEIYKMIDNNYSKYYPKSKEINEFIQLYISEINQGLFDNSKVVKFMNDNQTERIEINNIIKYNKYLPFSLLKAYLAKLKVTAEDKKSINSSDLLNFYSYCFCDLEEFEKKYYFSKINNINISINEENNTNINEIINNNDFLELIHEIMTSSVMKDAYLRISNWYLTNGKFDINGEMKITKERENLINGLSLFYYYEKFCEASNVDKYKNLFVVMRLPEFIKGFTFRFLKVVLNSEGIKFNPENNNYIHTLLKAYLVFVIIHEQNHYIKRFLNVDTDIQLCKTPQIGKDDEGEGGKLLIKLLFGDALINQSLNIKQAEYILNIKNWNKSNAIDFRKGFLSLITEEGEETSIIYLTSGKNSICDHTKLDS